MLTDDARCRKLTHKMNIAYLDVAVISSISFVTSSRVNKAYTHDVVISTQGKYMYWSTYLVLGFQELSQEKRTQMQEPSFRPVARSTLSPYDSEDLL